MLGVEQVVKKVERKINFEIRWTQNLRLHEYKTWHHVNTKELYSLAPILFCTNVLYHDHLLKKDQIYVKQCDNIIYNQLSGSLSLGKYDVWLLFFSNITLWQMHITMECRYVITFNGYLPQRLITKTFCTDVSCWQLDWYRRVIKDQDWELVSGSFMVVIIIWSTAVGCLCQGLLMISL